MEKFILNCKKRPNVGKSYNRKIRAQGFVPAVVYSTEVNEPLMFEAREFLKIIHKHPALENIIIELNIEDGKKAKSYHALVKDVQYHPVSDQIIHVDFQKISLKERISVKVPLVPKGESIGVKNGGVLEHLLRDLKIECFPQDIPEKIEVDVSSLDIGHSLHVEDLELPSNIKVLEDKEEVVFTCVAPREEAEEEVPQEEAPEEPEVIKKKEKEEGEKEVSGK